MEIRNAIIDDTTIDTGERDLLTVWLHLDYGGCAQGFGGYALYLSKGYRNHSAGSNYAGHFIYRCMQIAGVTNWKDMKGKTIRVKCDDGKVHAIGHIVKEDWFCPDDDFKNIL